MRAQSFHFRKPVFLWPGQEFTQTGGLGPDFPAFAAAGFPGEAMKNFREAQKKAVAANMGTKPVSGLVTRAAKYGLPRAAAPVSIP